MAPHEGPRRPLRGTKLLYTFWLKASSGVSQETWMMDAAPLRGTKLLYTFWLKASSGEFDSSERPEAQFPIIQNKWHQNDQASGRPIKPLKVKAMNENVK
jgi:hypothetical protein